MATPEERLASLAQHARRVIERVNKEPGSTGCDLARTLANAVLSAAVLSTSAKTPEPKKFSIAIEEPKE